MPGLDRVERTPHAACSVLQDVRIDHGRSHVAVAEELLDGADVVAALQQVGGEGVAERMAGHPFVETGLARCILHRPLQDALMEVMASLQAIGIFPARARRKDPLPAPRSRRGGNLALDGFRDPDGAESVLQIVVVNCTRLLELMTEQGTAIWGSMV